MLTTWWSILHSREGHSLITLRTREAHQETTWGQIKGVQALHTTWSLSAAPPLNHCYKTPHQIPLCWDTVLRSTSPLCPPLPGKTIKLFFSTSPRTLSLRFDSAPVHRGRVFDISVKKSWFTEAWGGKSYHSECSGLHQGEPGMVLTGQNQPHSSICLEK